MMHRNQLWEDLGKTTAVRRAAGSNKSLSHEEAEHIQATDSDWVLSWESYHNLPWGQGWRNTGAGETDISWMPSRSLEFNIHDLISSTRPERMIPILQACRTRPREEVGQKPDLADPHPSSSHADHVTLHQLPPDTVEKWKRAQRRLILGKKQPEPQGWADQRLLKFWNTNEQSPSLLLLPLCHSAAYQRHLWTSPSMHSLSVSWGLGLKRNLAVWAEL